MTKLDKAWLDCIEMWEKICDHLFKYPSSGETPVSLKSSYLPKKYEGSATNCIFCDYAYATSRPTCQSCPGVKVDPNFACRNSKYVYYRKPEKFLAKLHELNSIRLKKVKK
ncbi:MAG: hypothetical protein KAS32_25580 [Candidatus Peribacteraceae bacterium]|nr:hypothetical protein [Candidatus Peribacteraceae bacterium]